MPQSNGVKSWSYSRYGDYQTCPARFRYKHIAKLPEPSSPALARGGAADEAVTKYLDGSKRTLPKETSVDPPMRYGELAGRLAGLRKLKPETQLELATDNKWIVTGWRDWDRTWLRAKLDVMVKLDGGRVLHIVDNKTGRMYPEKHAEQIEIYACVAYAYSPSAEEIRAEMFYLDHGMSSSPAIFNDLPKTIARLRKKWEKLSAPMFRDTKFKEQPGQHCRWCPYSGAKGGPCKKG